MTRVPLFPIGVLALERTMPTTDRLDEEIHEVLHNHIHSRILQSGDEGYDDARTVWNPMIDKEPALIVQCTGAADVMRAVDVAREHDLLLLVKGGGHNVAGKAVCDGGLMIDLLPMDSVRIVEAPSIIRSVAVHH